MQSKPLGSLQGIAVCVRIWIEAGPLDVFAVVRQIRAGAGGDLKHAATHLHE